MLVQEVLEILPASSPRMVAGGVQLHATLPEVVRLNAMSRIASRVWLQLAQAPYADASDLYELAHDTPWEDWFTPQHSLRLDVSARRSPLKSLHFAMLQVKDGLCDRLRERLGARPDIAVHAPDVRVLLHVDEREAWLYLDTSGEVLFKRGWRASQGEAPLKENLAAALLRLVNWSPERALLDPFCGSGTFVIEAAQRAMGVAPGLQREFGFDQLLPFDPSWFKHWRQAQRELQHARRHATLAPMVGADISPAAIAAARANAAHAGVATCTRWQQQDAWQGHKPLLATVSLSHALILSNPPYEARMQLKHESNRQRAAAYQHHEADELQEADAALQAAWAAFGLRSRQLYPGAELALLSPQRQLPGWLRLRERRKPVVFNGALECRLFCFELRALRSAVAVTA